MGSATGEEGTTPADEEVEVVDVEDEEEARVEGRVLSVTPTVCCSPPEVATELVPPPPPVVVVVPVVPIRPVVPVVPVVPMVPVVPVDPPPVVTAELSNVHHKVKLMNVMFS